jgi:hypothetical protein
MVGNFPGGKAVDAHTRDNWRKIKRGLEEQGMTDCDFYRRACLICSGMKDPGPSWGSKGKASNQ